MRNQTLRIEAPKLNMGLVENDNSYIVRGNTANGYINQTVLKEDSECQAKVEELLGKIYQHQKAELGLFTATAGIELSSQYDKVLDVFHAEFEPEEE
jgi:hypothetical protein